MEKCPRTIYSYQNADQKESFLWPLPYCRASFAQLDDEGKLMALKLKYDGYKIDDRTMSLQEVLSMNKELIKKYVEYLNEALKYEDAIQARKDAEDTYFGDFKRTQFQEINL